MLPWNPSSAILGWLEKNVNTITLIDRLMLEAGACTGYLDSHCNVTKAASVS